MQDILITGGLGYIGSHTIIELLKYDNYNIIILDNLENSNISVLDKIKTITNSKNILFYEGSILNTELLDKIFSFYNIHTVIHFAGLKSVNESISDPIKYHKNNVSGTINLLDIMEKFNVKNLIFSSSATIYGNNKAPFTENSQTGINITNPYGKTKYLIEEILKDLNDWNIYSLRYFNPIGCHESGLIGDNPNGIPNNLMPYILRVASKQYPYLNVYGNDYNTNDGSPTRDFIHVVDLAMAHVKALQNLKKGFNSLNLGTGKETSVFQLIDTFEKTNNIKIPIKICDRRDGDIDVSFCNISKAFEYLNWYPTKNISDMCKDSWNFINK